MSGNHLIYAMLSHRGRVRRGNEDACAAAPEAGAYVVCDGMGGAAAGEIASTLAVDTFVAHLTDPAAVTASGARFQPQRPMARLHAAIQAANHAVYRRSVESPELSGMGTTLVGMLHAPLSTAIAEEAAAPPRRSEHNHLNSRSSDPPTLWLGHVGDSRCYRWRKGKLEQLTQDHSYVEAQLRDGQITAAQAARSPMRNLITRAIGSQPTVEAEIQSHRPQPNDLYLLASDGLTHEVSDGELAEILKLVRAPRTKPGLTAACEAMIKAANRKGGHDNITVLLVGVTI